MLALTAISGAPFAEQAETIRDLRARLDDSRGRAAPGAGTADRAFDTPPDRQRPVAAEGGTRFRAAGTVVATVVPGAVRARRRSRREEKAKIELSVVPRTAPAVVLSTILHACRTLIGTARDADELIGLTSATATLEALETEFKSNGWLER
jgi:hypothetical protein